MLCNHVNVEMIFWTVYCIVHVMSLVYLNTEINKANVFVQVYT